MNNSKSNNNDGDDAILISNPQHLQAKGIIQISIPPNILNLQHWSSELTRITPLIATLQDNEYAFYRNILEDEPDFPFDDVLHSAIGSAIQRYFGIEDVKKEIRLDDAFCVHYNTEQCDTTCAKHVDPSDITVNLCLEKSEDVKGSMVMFYGTQKLHDLHVEEVHGDDDDGEHHQEKEEENGTSTTFLVDQKEGYATIHWGNHPHEVTPLEAGKRTNVILTYCYTDKSRSDVATRCCYAMSSSS